MFFYASFSFVRPDNFIKFLSYDVYDAHEYPQHSYEKYSARPAKDLQYWVDPETGVIRYPKHP